jgi:hypothetical protein
MKISVLIPSLASNGVTRGWILAQLLKRLYEVEMIGRLGKANSLPMVRGLRVHRGTEQ